MAEFSRYDYDHRVHIAIEDLPRAGGTSSGAYLAAAADVLIAKPNPGLANTEDTSRASLEELHRLARVRGNKQMLVVLVDNVTSQDASSRRVWQREVSPGLVCGIVLVCESLLARAIGSFFIGIRGPIVPTRMVATVDEAIAWAEECLRDHGGPIQE